MPKLNLQFLTVSDYLLRNFLLFRLESAYEIRVDLVDAIKRVGPKLQPFAVGGVPNRITFGGWARMALPITSIAIDEVCFSIFNLIFALGVVSAMIENNYPCRIVWPSQLTRNILALLTIA